MEVSVEEILERSLWGEFCGLRGMDVMSLGENILSDNDIELSDVEAEELGLM